jgi:hypothetical protein
MQSPFRYPGKRRWILLLSLLAVTVGAPAANAGTTPPPKPKKAHRTCSQLAYQFRELLEPIVEASIDGKPDRAGPTTTRIAAWWKMHHAEIRLRASADSLMPALADAGQSGRALEAARLAVVLADISFGWCGRPPTVAGQLMRIDLAGMTGWLRAQGVDLDWPAGLPETTAAVLTELRSRGESSLADSLDSAILATTKTPVAAGGDVAAARTLLDLVDGAEQRLR